MAVSISNHVRFSGAALLGAVSVGALSAISLQTAPTAAADCASFFGVGNTAACTSTVGSIAIAKGLDAQAHAGSVGVAIASGAGALATTSGGMANFAVAQGDGNVARATGTFSGAVAIGPTQTSQYGGPTNTAIAGPGPLAVAIAYTSNYGETVTQENTGVNFNGAVFPGASRSAKKAAAAVAGHVRTTPSAAAASNSGPGPRAAHSGSR